MFVAEEIVLVEQITRRFNMSTITEQLKFISSQVVDDDVRSQLHSLQKFFSRDSHYDR
jgi:hypothetical protein